jgi:hypothetical protein
MEDGQIPGSQSGSGGGFPNRLQELVIPVQNCFPRLGSGSIGCRRHPAKEARDQECPDLSHNLSS